MMAGGMDLETHHPHLTLVLGGCSSKIDGQSDVVDVENHTVEQLVYTDDSERTVVDPGGGAGGKLTPL